MLSFDTNQVVYAANADAPEQPAASSFFQSIAERQDIVVCELMLVELYLKLRNPRIFRRPLGAPAAAAYSRSFAVMPTGN